MTLIKSISGIRGTIGGKEDENLTPIDIVKFAAAFAQLLKNQSGKSKLNIVVGRDARISGKMAASLVESTLHGMGVNVLSVGLSTTPTVEVAVKEFNADGGIILTASHNPKQWNALKLLNAKGEFISAEEGKEVLAIGENRTITFAEVDELGTTKDISQFNTTYLQTVANHELVDTTAIQKANFSVVVDGINSTGGVCLPELLKLLGVNNVAVINAEPTGDFAHNPEPLKDHLTELSAVVRAKKATLGIVVDPDVDRLAFVDENGEMFGEEYTLVAVADYVLGKKGGNTVSNLSSTRALADVTAKHGHSYSASAVGEVNVVNEMKATNAIIGGEGNGGIIFPELHYGRDALIGVALFLTGLAEFGGSMSAYKATFPFYAMAKKRLDLTPDLDVDALLAQAKEKYKDEKISTVDGVKIDFAEGWVHLRKSNTEPIIRIYSEGKTEAAANELADEVMSFLASVV